MTESSLRSLQWEGPTPLQKKDPFSSDPITSQVPNSAPTPSAARNRLINRHDAIDLPMVADRVTRACDRFRSRARCRIRLLGTDYRFPANE
ncbi:hypothetical protein WM40_13390 [Robbsia andropogonis]|uniref:Uncharacterized protein n=1 Tax=Robbsia andropogonis TaxID=28092 RepID=A0A0F5JZC7_9BURK|nr:hypothetical protein WM40_13390 [Robbsia andropogonis]